MRNVILRQAMFLLSLILLVFVTSSQTMGQVRGSSRPRKSVDHNESQVTIEISTEKNMLELGEPGCVQVCYKNHTPSAIALDLKRISLIDPYNNLTFLSDNLKLIHRNASVPSTYLLIPANGEVSMLFANLRLPLGERAICMEYQHKASNVEYSGDAVSILKERIISNKIRMTVEHPSSDNINRLERLLLSKIDEIPDYERFTPQYNRAHEYWVDMSPYSIPVLLKHLDLPEAEKRLTILDVLSSIATFQGTSPEKQSCAFWSDLIKGYEREKDLEVSAKYLDTIGYCVRLPKDQQNSIKTFLRKEMKQNKEEILRRTAAWSYLNFNALEALEVIIGEGLIFDDTLGEDFIACSAGYLRLKTDVPQADLTEAMAKQWLEENRSKIEEFQEEKDKFNERIRKRQEKGKLEWRKLRGEGN